MIGGMPIPAEMDEGTFLGTLYGEPVEVVKCETSDLEVPAGAEVVIEGHVSVTRDATEGPYAEFHGWSLPETSPEPTYTIEAITYRDNPIWPVSATGRPPEDSQIAPAIRVSAELVALLTELGYEISADADGRATGAHLAGRRAIFVGDLVDRGPDTPGVLRLVMLPALSYPTAPASATACSPIFARVVASSSGLGDSSITFWLRRWIEHSRSPR